MSFDDARPKKKRCNAFGLLRPFDIIIVATVFILSLSAFLFLPKDGNTVTVIWHGKEIYRGDLNTDAVITTPDALNTIRITDGSVYMESAQCRNQACVEFGPASAARPIVCIPNQVIITVSDDAEVDSVSW